MRTVSVLAAGPRQAHAARAGDIRTIASFLAHAAGVRHLTVIQDPAAIVTVGEDDTVRSNCFDRSVFSIASCMPLSGFYCFD